MALLAERGVGERLQRLVQRAELVDDRREVLARVEPAVEGPQLGVQRVQSLEQRVELAVATSFSFTP